MELWFNVDALNIKNYIRFTFIYIYIYINIRNGTTHIGVEHHWNHSTSPWSNHMESMHRFELCINKKPRLGSPHLISYINLLFPTMDSWTVVMMVVALIGTGVVAGWIDRYIPMVVVSRLEVGWIPVRGKSILVLPATSAARSWLKNTAHTQLL